MKKICLLFVMVATGIFSCNSMDPESYQVEIAKLNDTLFKVLPTLKRVSVEVKTDFGTTLNITLGDKSLFNAPDSSRKKATEIVASVSSAVFLNKLPEKGKVIFVAEENTIEVKEGAEKTVEMNLKMK